MQLGKSGIFLNRESTGSISLDVFVFRESDQPGNSNGMACNHAMALYVECMIFSAVITAAEEGGFVAFNPETGTTTQGETFDEAMANLREATELYLEVFPMKSKAPAVLTCFELSHAQAAGC
jgi:predicted RNase H-like HicB family nuclease